MEVLIIHFYHFCSYLYPAQVFLSNRAVYAVVFDLRLDLNEPVKVEVFHHDNVSDRWRKSGRYLFLYPGEQ